MSTEINGVEGKLLGEEDEQKPENDFKMDQTEKKCSICLTTFTDETHLSDCSHSFCYTCICEWMKVSESCPLCKAPVKFLNHIVEGKLKQKMLSELKAEAETLRISILSREQPLNSEREAIREYKSRLSCSLNLAGQSRSDRTDVVSRLNFVRALRSDMSNMTRGQLMADSRFRHLIYSMNLKWLPLTRVSLSSAFSPAVAMREGERARERILPWVLRELPLVLKCNLPDETRQRLANEIFNAILNYQINSPNFQCALRNTGMLREDYLNQFCELLYEFCASNLSMESHDENSSFHLERTQAPVIQADSVQEDVVNDEVMEINLTEDRQSSSSDEVAAMYHRMPCHLPSASPQRESSASSRHSSHNYLLSQMLPSFNRSLQPIIQRASGFFFLPHLQTERARRDRDRQNISRLDTLIRPRRAVRSFPARPVEEVVTLNDDEEEEGSRHQRRREVISRRPDNEDLPGESTQRSSRGEECISEVPSWIPVGGEEGDVRVISQYPTYSDQHRDDLFETYYSSMSSRTSSPHTSAQLLTRHCARLRLHRKRLQELEKNTRRRIHQLRREEEKERTRVVAVEQPQSGGASDRDMQVVDNVEDEEVDLVSRCVPEADSVETDPVDESVQIIE